MELTAKVDELEGKPASARACTREIDNILKDDSKAQFYSGFPSKEHLQICFEFLGPTVNHLQYWKANNIKRSQRKKCGHQRRLSPLEEFFVDYIWGCLKRIWLIGLVYMYLLFHAYLSPW